MSRPVPEGYSPDHDVSNCRFCGLAYRGKACGDCAPVEVWLCEDCTVYAVNGDLSGIDGDARARAVEAGVGRLGDLSSDNDGAEDGFREFSACGCDACGTHLAGAMYRFAALQGRP